MNTPFLTLGRSRRKRPSPTALCLAALILASMLFGSVPVARASPTATTTKVVCTPNSVGFTGWAACKATVSGSSPTGTVTFSQTDLNYSSLGTFDSTTCTLSGGSCTVHFSYTASSCIIYCQETDFQIDASYGGDSNNLASSGSVPKLNFHSCWFSECLINTSPGGDFTDYFCAVGNNPTDTFADCKQADTDYTSGSYDLSNQGIELPGAGMLSAMAGCAGVTTAITFAVGGPYASGSSPGQVDTAALLGACAISFPLYMSGAAFSACCLGGKAVPDSGLAFLLEGAVIAGGYPAQVAVGDLAVFVDLGCGFVNYYCFGANLTGNIIANPFDIQQKQVPFAPQFFSNWGAHGGFTSIGWSLPSCTNSSFCTRVSSLCGPSGTTAPCINPSREGTAGEFDTLDIGHPDYSQINTYAPIKCAVGLIDGMSIGYDGDVDFNVNSSNAAPLVNAFNEKGGSLGPPNGIVAEIPPADRWNTNITPDHHPVRDTIMQMRNGTEIKICGRWVTDTRDLWNELHPITFLELLPTFTVAASPPDLTVQSGEQASFTATVTLKAGPSGATPITLSVSGLPFAAAATFSVNPVALNNPSVMTGTSTMTVSTATIDRGDFPLTISGTDQSGLVVETATVNLHLYDYTISLSPSDETVLRGGTAFYTATLTLLPASTVIGVPAEPLSASVLPGGTSAFGAPSVMPTLSGSSTSFDVSTSGPPGGALGDYIVTVTGTSPGGTTRSGSAGIHVYDFGVTAAVSPASAAYACTALPSPCLYVLTSGWNTYSTDVQLTPGSTAVSLPQISLSLSNLPSGTTDTFTPGLGTPTFSSTLNVTTSNAPAGTYTLTITGTDSRPEGGTRTVDISLVVITPQQALQLVINQVLAYEAGGVITKGQANALITLLQSAIDNLNAGKTSVACNQLNAFTNIANSYVAKGFLKPPQADLLLGGPLGVYAIMNSIPC